MPLISCEISLTLTWSASCVLADIARQTAREIIQQDPQYMLQQMQHLK